MRSIRRFEDREDAGRLLAVAVARIARRPCVVAGIPRGGLAVAQPVAEGLGVVLAAAFVRKLSLPEAPELTIGTIDDEGREVFSADAIAALRAGSAEVARVRVRVRAEMQRQVALYGLPRLQERARDHTVVLVDDGVATGLTMRAAIALARRHGAAHVIVATPCAASRAMERLVRRADDAVALMVEPELESASRCYRRFEPFGDDEVLQLLARARR